MSTGSGSRWAAVAVAVLVAFVVAMLGGKAVAHSWLGVDGVDAQWVVGTTFGLVVTAVVTAAGTSWAARERRTSSGVSSGVRQSVTDSVIVARRDGPAIGNYNAGPPAVRPPWDDRV